MKSQQNILTKRRFLPLFVTQFFGAFNDNAFKNAFLIWFTFDPAIQQATPISTELMLPLAAGIFILPFFLFSAIAGQIADKYDKSKLSARIKGVEIILMLIGGACFYITNVYGLLLVLFAMGIQSTFFGPIKYSLLPEHLSEEELVSGNAMIEGSTFLAILLGTVFGGAAIHLENGVAILSLAVIICAVLGWAASLFIPASRTHPQAHVSFNLIAATQETLRCGQAVKSAWLSVIAISWFWFLGATVLTQLPNFTKMIVMASEDLFIVLLSFFSIGIAAGSLTCNSLLKGEIKTSLVPHGIVGMTAGLIVLILSTLSYQCAFTDQFPDVVAGASSDLITPSVFLSMSWSSWGILLSLFSISFFGGIYTVPLYAIMQHHSSEKHLSQVIASNNILNALFMVLSSIFTMLLFSMNLAIINSQRILILFALVAICNLIFYAFIRKIVTK